jgi:hypothetical protein
MPRQKCIYSTAVLFGLHGNPIDGLFREGSGNFVAYGKEHRGKSKREEEKEQQREKYLNRRWMKVLPNVIMP